MIIPPSHATSFKMIPSENVDDCKFSDQLDQDLDLFMDQFKDCFDQIGPFHGPFWTSLD